MKYIVTLFLLTGCYNPGYYTTQGVEIREKCEVCPSPEIVDYAIEFYANRAPNLLEWDQVREALTRVRLFLYDKPVTKHCWQAEQCYGIVYASRIGWDICLEWTSANNALYYELTKILVLINDGWPDYNYQQRTRYWDPTDRIKREYLESLDN
jgi:hypothetical protein